MSGLTSCVLSTEGHLNSGSALVFAALVEIDAGVGCYMAQAAGLLAAAQLGQEADIYCLVLQKQEVAAEPSGQYERFVATAKWQQ